MRHSRTPGLVVHCRMSALSASSSRSTSFSCSLIGSSFILPFFIRDARPAAVPVAAEPAEPSWVCIQGTTHGVE